jgi:hypothetical protein
MAGISFNTSKYVRTPAGTPAPVAPLASSMQRQGAQVGALNPNLVTPSTLSQPVRQPTRTLDYTDPAGTRRSSTLPPSSTTTQTGQGGGQSTIPGPSVGQPGQSTGLGGNPAGSAGGAPGPNPGPNTQPGAPPPAGASRPRVTTPAPAAPPDPQSPFQQLQGPNTGAPAVNAAGQQIDAAGHVIQTDPNATHLDANGNMVKANGSVVSYNADPNKQQPDWYGSNSGWEIGPNGLPRIVGTPTAPTGGDSSQQFTTAAYRSAQTPTGANWLKNIGKYGTAAANTYLSQPGAYTVADFNQVAQSNPVMAVQMIASGGQAYMDAIMKANGWTKQQINQFINSYGSGALPGITNQGLTAAGYTGNFGGGYHPAPPPPPPPTNTPAPPPPPPPAATATGGTEAGFGYFDPYWTQKYGAAHP